MLPYVVDMCLYGGNVSSSGKTCGGCRSLENKRALTSLHIFPISHETKLVSKEFSKRQRFQSAHFMRRCCSTVSRTSSLRTRAALSVSSSRHTFIALSEIASDFANFHHPESPSIIRSLYSYFPNRTTQCSALINRDQSNAHLLRL